MRADGNVLGCWALVAFGISLWVLWEFGTGWAFWGPAIAVVITILFTMVVVGAAQSGDSWIGPDADPTLTALMWIGVSVWTIHSACNTSCTPL